MSLSFYEHCHTCKKKYFFVVYYEPLYNNLPFEYKYKTGNAYMYPKSEY